MKKQKRILAILLLLLLFSLYYGYRLLPRQDGTGGAAKRSTASAPRTAAPRPSRAATAPVGGIPALRVDLLEPRTEPYPGVRRDLFYAFGAGPTIAATERSGSVTPPPPVVAAPPPFIPPQAPPPTPQQLVAQELARFTFMGFVKKDRRKTIFLASGGEIFLAHEGSRFGRQQEFLVTSVTDNELKIEQEQVGTVVIPLIDQKILAPAIIGRPAAGMEGARPVPVVMPDFGAQPVPVNPVEIPSGDQPGFMGEEPDVTQPVEEHHEEE